MQGDIGQSINIILDKYSMSKGQAVELIENLIPKLTESSQKLTLMRYA